MEFDVFARWGRCTSPDRQNLEFFDFEVSKKVKISAKKWFLKEKKSWEAFGSRYFVWRIVLGCGSVWDARNIANFMKIIKIVIFCTKWHFSYTNLGNPLRYMDDMWASWYGQGRLWLLQRRCTCAGRRRPTSELTGESEWGGAPGLLQIVSEMW